MNLNPELHLSQLSIAGSCRYLERQTSDIVRTGSERRFSTTSFKKQIKDDEGKIIRTEKDPEAGPPSYFLGEASDSDSEEDESGNEGHGRFGQGVHVPVNVKVVDGVSVSAKCGKPERKGWRRYIGLFLTILHVIAFTLSALIVKLLHDYHPFTIAFWRFQAIFIPSVCLLVHHGVDTCKKRDAVEKAGKGNPPKPLFDQLWPPTNKKNIKHILLLTMRCWAGAYALFAYFFSLKYITIADSFVIGAAGPCFVSILAFVFLKESLGIFTVLLTLTTLSGVMVISRPPFLTGAEEFDQDTLIGFAICLSCTIVGSVSFVLLRYLKTIHFAIISSSFGAWGTLLSLIFAFSLNVFQLPSTWLEVLYLAGIGFLTFTAQITITKALQTEEASVVSLLKTTNIIFAFVWQFIFLSVSPDFYSVVGATIVLLGCTGSVFRRWLSQLPENDGRRITFWFVLR